MSNMSDQLLNSKIYFRTVFEFKGWIHILNNIFLNIYFNCFPFVTSTLYLKGVFAFLQSRRCTFSMSRLGDDNL